MAIGEARFTKDKQSKRESDLVRYVEQLRQDMSTDYRERAIRLAKFALDEYEGVSKERVSNMDMMNVQMSYAIVNQRLSTLFSNPSRAVYRVVDENKADEVEILKQVNEYDKEVSRYNSTYQEMERTANIEGSCFFRVAWHEEFDNEGFTVGIPSTKLVRVRMNDFWWDKNARTPEEMNHGLERQVMSHEEFLRRFKPLEGAGFKNISAVKPMNSVCEGSVYREEWEENENNGNKITVWYFETRGMLIDGKLEKKRLIFANGKLIFESDKLSIPRSINGRVLLPWSKIDGIPTGYMVGMGIPILIRHPQEAFNRLLTIAVAQAELAGSPPLLLRAGADIDFDDYPVFPGATIEVRGTGKSIAEDYQWLQVPDISGGAQNIMEQLIRYVIMLTGVDVMALFVPASEKAITTENKRQIQEKLLKFSVEWNEEHGFYDMELRRLALIQKWYPLKRTFLEEDFDGMARKVERFPQIPVKDHEVQQMQGRKRKIKLNFKKGGFTRLEITPEMLRFNVDLTIEGASRSSDKDIIEKRNFIENIQLLLSIPSIAAKVNESPEKPMEFILKQADITEEEFFGDAGKEAGKIHPALKEIMAIQLVEELKSQNFNVPDDIPIPEDYDPREYVDIFNEFAREKYKSLSVKSRKAFDQRFEYHQQNNINPFFRDIQEKREEQEEQAKMMEQQQLAQGAGKIPTPETPSEEQPLTATVRQKAGQLAARARGQ